MKAIKIRKGPDGLHIFDRKSGTNILLDEMILPRETWTDCPRQVSIALTNACDLKCSHCYASKKPATLHTDQVKQWMLELDKAGCFGIGFGGGEPTLHPDFVELCRFGQEETSLAISFTTHGHRLSDPLLAYLCESVNFVRVSMDGIGSTYEAIRGRSFAELTLVLSKLKNYLPFGINFVVNRRTINELTDAAKLVEDIGATELLLLPEEAVGLGRKVDQDSLTRLTKWVENYQGNLRLSISSSHKESVQTDLALMKESEHLAFAHIDAEGLLKSSSFDATGVKIGNAGVMAAYHK